MVSQLYPTLRERNQDCGLSQPGAPAACPSASALAALRAIARLLVPLPLQLRRWDGRVRTWRASELSWAAAGRTSVARWCLLPEEPEARRVELEDSREGPGEGPLAACSSWWRGSLSRKCPGDRVLPLLWSCLSRPGCTASLSLRPSSLPLFPFPAGGPAPARAAESLPRPWGQPSLSSLPRVASQTLADRRPLLLALSSSFCLRSGSGLCPVLLWLFPFFFRYSLGCVSS